MGNKLKNEMKEENDRTTIWISKTNHKKLLSFGGMHMSMNDVLDKILAHQVGASKVNIEEERVGR